MARVGRLAGAILAETGGDYYLVGNPKQPCDWRAAGFEQPVEIDPRSESAGRGPAGSAGEGARALGIDARVRPAQRLARCGTPVLAAPVLELDVEGEALARLLADVFVIARTGSVSERLWRLVIGEADDHDDPRESRDSTEPPAVISARWLGEMPPAVWRIVRDAVLRCT